MKKYKLIKGSRYDFPGSNFKEGEIYSENKLLTEEKKIYREVLHYAKIYPEDWEEVFEFNVRDYLVDILNTEGLFVRLDNYEEAVKLFEVIDKVKYYLKNELVDRDPKLKAIKQFNGPICINLFKREGHSYCNYMEELKNKTNEEAISNSRYIKGIISLKEIIEKIKQEANI